MHQIVIIYTEIILMIGIRKHTKEDIFVLQIYLSSMIPCSVLTTSTVSFNPYYPYTCIESVERKKQFL